MFSCEIAAAKIEEGGEGVTIEGGGTGRTGRTNDSLMTVVHLSEKSGVGMLCGGDGASQLSKPTERGLDHVRGLLVAVEMICNISMPNHKVLKVGTTPSAIEPLRLPTAFLSGLLTLPIQVG
ncbi:glycolate oxidase subunit GlcE [Babesia caballi]|uniref:Glycolate oxidase subunit GlcE n=1 Tax=Babesia caballi TaxID=5871 RepID=A0AAV4LYM0_BABCB|nr:glycolate oxidase subunit GlcE [Babesia caballi]